MTPDPTLSELLRDSPIAPFLDQPVNNVLAVLGLPPLPQVQPAPPLPGLPPLPVIDLNALTKPITDLAAGFGTGQPGAGGAPDPAQVISGISSALQIVMSAAQGALGLLTAMDGAGPQAAAAKGVEAAKNGAALTAQGTQVAAGVVSAAGTVATGAAQMAAVITHVVTSLTAAAPALATPFGQGFAVATIIEGLAEAIAVTAKTRSELAIHSTKMVDTGRKVAITSAPTTFSTAPTRMMPQLNPAAANSNTPASLSTLWQAIAQPLSSLDPGLIRPTQEVNHPPVINRTAQIVDEKATTGFGGGVTESAIIDGTTRSTGTLHSSTTLAPWTGKAVAQSEIGVEQSTADPIIAQPESASSSLPVTPMASAAPSTTAIRFGDSNPVATPPAYLVTVRHGNEVVGDVARATPPVVGEVEYNSDAPDKTFTL
ncbi:hypothetical protein [Nocardia sp. CDC160]|uniref:hypothetical protein n=1 Tax=Nocardia sp. CDC160 TaxID=3112166 RepID=UPI002DB71376|nr:hypothetical protein [Nocardia sp. CDC160]MEC3920675.1 hypothetical protein [Nocardia sp. CDC160]